MDVDKGFIERSNFSSSRRGYDQEEVDAHLKEISQRVEQFRREQSSAKLAGAAAEQVRIIVEAAERSAAEIEEKAELQAKRTAQEAEQSADQARQRADAAADEQIAKVEQATTRMIEQAETLDTQVGQMLGQLQEQAAAIVEALRSGAESVDTELGHIRSGLHEVHTARGSAAPEIASVVEEPAEAGPPDAEPEVVEAVSDTVEEEPAPAAVEAAGDSGIGEPEPLAEASEEVGEDAGAPTGRFQRRGGGAEGARLVALNMALNGTPRSETARYLSENFEIDDQEALLDDVYTQVGGPA